MSYFRYWAGLKKAMAYVFAYTTAVKHIMWNVGCRMEYGTPNQALASQETTTTEQQQPSWSWWDYIIPRSRPVQAATPQQPQQTQTEHTWSDAGTYDGVDLRVRSPVAASPENLTRTKRELSVELGPNEMSFSDFVREGYRRETEAERPEDEDNPWQVREATTLRLYPDPELYQDKEKHFYLDRENIEVRGPLEISLLPDRITMFCSEGAVRPLPREEEARPATNATTGKWWSPGSSSGQQRAPSMQSAMATKAF